MLLVVAPYVLESRASGKGIALTSAEGSKLHIEAKNIGY